MPFIVDSWQIAGLQVQIEQRYMRQRERAHRNTSESTNLRVVW